MNTQETFKTIARRKIAGWYSLTEWEDKADAKSSRHNHSIRQDIH